MGRDVLGEGSNHQPRNQSKQSAKERVQMMPVRKCLSFEPKLECCRVGEGGSKVGDPNEEDG